MIEQPLSRLNNIDQHLQCVINIDQPLINFDQFWLTKNVYSVVELSILV